MMEKKRIVEIVDILRKRYSDKGRGEVTSTSKQDPFQVLVSAIISQRNRDEVTRELADKLLKKAKTPKDMMKLGKKNIEKSISSANYYRTKAKRIYEISKMLVDNYGGKVPDTRDELVTLPGVGGKTADIVLLVSHGKDVIPVDTHVAVVSRRLDWTDEKDREKIRKDLHKIFDEKMRGYVNILLVEFGKEFCRKHRPRCKVCPIQELCPYPDKNL